MKKIYSLFATVALATGMFAQVTVFSGTFSDITGTGGNDGSWSGSAAGTAIADGSSSYTTGGNWTVTRAYRADGCLKMGTGSVKGVVTTPSISLTGSGVLTFRAGAWNATSENTNLVISATGATLSQGSVTLTKGAFNSYSVNITGATGAVTITFEGNSASNSRFFIDDIIVQDGTLAVADFKKVTPNFVKNTLVKNDEIVFGADVKDIKVYTLSGAVVKTGSVKNGSTLNVAELAKGNYIVTGILNNEPVSQKILKD